jgi:DNA modification methylase
MKEFGHPAMFPEELANRVLKLFSFKGDVILDPFAGVGTTCLSAHINQRLYLGIDISPEYCQTAEDRLRLLF